MTWRDDMGLNGPAPTGREVSGRDPFGRSPSRRGLYGGDEVTPRRRPTAVTRALPVLGLVGLMWVLEIIDIILRGALDGLGIRPLEIQGLIGVVFSPLLHGSIPHLISNTGAMIVLGVMIAWITGRWAWITAGIWLLSGLGTWLIGGPGTLHIGASGVVYGYAAFLVTYAILSRRFVALLAAVVTVSLYGGIVFGLLPVNPHISWQGHLMGAAAGVLVAFLDTRQAREDRKIRALARRS